MAVARISPLPAVPRNSPASSLVMAVIMTILAAREHHCSATFPAMYFLLSLTVPISLLLIIMAHPPRLILIRFI